MMGILKLLTAATDFVLILLMVIWLLSERGNNAEDRQYNVFLIIVFALNIFFVTR